jgi:integrase
VQEAQRNEAPLRWGGLYLRAAAAGTASWVFRYEIDGVGHEHGLGSVATFDLDEARERARLCRQLLHDGKDPIAERQAARSAVRTASPAAASKSFKFCTIKYIGFREASWRSDKHRRDWTSSLERYAFPVFDQGNQLVSTITPEDVLKVLEPQWVERTETLRRVRSRIEMVLDWAKGQKLRSGENPARWKGNLDAHLNASVRQETVHFPALTYHQIPALVAELRAPAGQEGPDVVDDALLFCFLTAGRTKEVRLAEWCEIDLAARLRR